MRYRRWCAAIRAGTKRRGVRNLEAWFTTAAQWVQHHIIGNNRMMLEAVVPCCTTERTSTSKIIALTPSQEKRAWQRSS